MKDKLLITFGCSWTFGVGLNYEPGMSSDLYKANAWNPTVADKFSFRKYLVDRFDFEHLNFSSGGSSNCQQLRRAKTFFTSNQFQKIQQQFKEIVVLWGITSTARKEIYDNASDNIHVFFLSKDNPISKNLLLMLYNHEHEVFTLAKEMCFWNLFFKTLGVKNFWYDTFNHHDYTTNSPAINLYKDKYLELSGPDWPSWDDYLKKQWHCNDLIAEEISSSSQIHQNADMKFTELINTSQIPNLMFDTDNPRDLMSGLAIDHGMINLDNVYHRSYWFGKSNKQDSNRVDFLISKGLLNPISFHPTISAHKKIADRMTDYLIKNL